MTITLPRRVECRSEVAPLERPGAAAGPAEGVAIHRNSVGEIAVKLDGPVESV